MTENRIELMKLLAEAIYREQSAWLLYSELSSKIGNPEGKKTFAALAKDEGGHRSKLEDWYREMFGEAFLFQEDKTEKVEVSIEDQTGALAALDLALEAEKKAAKRYEALAFAAPSEQFAGLCKDLAAEEWGHFETINAEKHSIMDAFYWYDMDYGAHMED